MKYSLLLSCMLLAGCDAMDHNMSRTNNLLRTNYDETRHRIAQYIYHTDPQQQHTAPVAELPPSSFCYQLLMDVMCYDRPRPDLHLQLVAVQGEHAYDYTDFMPREVIKHDAMLPASDVATTSNPIIMTDLEGKVVKSDIKSPAVRDATKPVSLMD